MACIKNIKIGSTTYLIEPTLYAATAGSASAITATISNFELQTGVTVFLKITSSNSASATLNINGTGAKYIKYKTALISASALKPNGFYAFVYDGSYWNLVGELNIGTVTSIKPGNGLITGTSGTDQTTITGSGIISIGEGKVTNAMLEGSIANEKLTNSSITIGSKSIGLGESATLAEIGVEKGSLPFAVGTGTAAVTSSPYNFAKWEASIPEITSLYDGLTVAYKIPVAGNGSYGTCLQINSLGYHPVVYGTNSMIGTRYGVNNTILMVYNSTVSGTVYDDSASSSTITGCWVVINDYDANTTFVSNLHRGGGNFTADSALYRYQLLVYVDDDTLSPFNNNNNTTGDTKTILSSLEFLPFKPIYYYATTTNVAADARMSAAYLAFAYSSIDLRYSFNATNLDLTSNEDVYMVVSPQSNGKVKIASELPFAQTLPSTKDGLWYIYIGRATGSTKTSLQYYHPIYYHDGTQIVEVKEDSYQNYISSQNFVVRDTDNNNQIVLQWDDDDESLDFVFM